MERPAPVRKSHTSTADLLTWPEGAAQELAAGATPPPNRRPHQVPRRLLPSPCHCSAKACSLALPDFFFFFGFGAAVGGDQ